MDYRFGPNTYAHEIKKSVNIKAVAQAVEIYNTGAAILSLMLPTY